MAELSLRLFTRRELAAAFRVHMQTITGWEAQGLPIAARGSKGRPSRYALADCVRWYLDRELAARGVSGEKLDPATERALLDRRRREEIDHRLAIQRGVTAPVAALEAIVSQQIVQARTAFLGLHARLAQEVPHLGRAGAAVADRLVREILEDLGRGLYRAGATTTTNGHNGNRNGLSTLEEES